MKYLDRVKWARRVGPEHQLSMGARFLLLTIADHANDDGICWPSVPTLAHKMGCSGRQVFRWLAEIEAVKLISRETGNVGKSNRYQLLTHDSQSRTHDSQSRTHDTRSHVPVPESHPNLSGEPSKNLSENVSRSRAGKRRPVHDPLDDFRQMNNAYYMKNGGN